MTEIVIIYVLGGKDLAESTLMLLMSHLIANCFYVVSNISWGLKLKGERERDLSVSL